MTALKFLPEMFSWRVLLDLLLISIGMYVMYRSLKRLGAWKLVLGILLAMGVFTLANALDLKGIRWAYTNLSNVLLIALIVIFQPELRKLFERAVSFRRREQSPNARGLSALFAETAFALAAREWGGILVFPGKDPLKEHLSGGTPLNAEPGMPLLLSIFDPHSPGHDGAVIVENGKLVRFGVRLPLSSSEALHEDMGTRHHASMGLAEATDALVLCISEERGTVTIFHNGKAEIAARKEFLATRIRDHWDATASYPLPLKNGADTKRHLLEAGLSFALACLFYVAIILTGEETLERGFTVPVEYTSTPSNIALSGDKPAEVQIHLAGPKSEISGLSPDQLSLRIDLSDTKPGRQTITVSELNFHLPRNVRLLDVDPARFNLTLTELEGKTLDIKPNLTGKLPKNIRLLAAVPSPSHVDVLLPARSNKDDPANLPTTPISLNGLERSATITCDIMPPAGVQPASGHWPKVEVHLEVVLTP